MGVDEETSVNCGSIHRILMNLMILQYRWCEGRRWCLPVSCTAFLSFGKEGTQLWFHALSYIMVLCYIWFVWMNNVYWQEKIWPTQLIKKCRLIQYILIQYILIQYSVKFQAEIHNSFIHSKGIYKQTFSLLADCVFRAKAHKEGNTPCPSCPLHLSRLCCFCHPVRSCF